MLLSTSLKKLCMMCQIKSIIIERTPVSTIFNSSFFSWNILNSIVQEVLIFLIFWGFIEAALQCSIMIFHALTADKFIHLLCIAHFGL